MFESVVDRTELFGRLLYVGVDLFPTVECLLVLNVVQQVFLALLDSFLIRDPHLPEVAHRLQNPASNSSFL
jgi:hypothetical protein